MTSEPMSEIPPLPTHTGVFFEGFAAGQTVTSPARTVTETDIVSFAALTGDWAPIHTDAVYAGSQLYGERIAHGMLGASLAAALAMRTGILNDTILAFREIQSWKFSLPIRIGDTIRVQMKITGTRPVPRLGGGLVSMGVELLNQQGQIVQHGGWVVLVKSQTSPTASSSNSF